MWEDNINSIHPFALLLPLLPPSTRSFVFFLFYFSALLSLFLLPPLSNTLSLLPHTASAAAFHRRQLLQQPTNHHHALCLVFVCYKTLPPTATTGPVESNQLESPPLPLPPVLHQRCALQSIQSRYILATHCHHLHHPHITSHHTAHTMLSTAILYLGLAASSLTLTSKLLPFAPPSPPRPPLAPPAPPPAYMTAD